MVPEAAVADGQEHRRVGSCGPRPQREGHTASDGSRRAVDDAAASLNCRLGPLAELTAVGDEDGIVVVGHGVTERAGRLEGMQGLALRRLDGVPGRWAVGDRGLHLPAPIGVSEPAAVQRGKHGRGSLHRAANDRGVRTRRREDAASKLDLRLVGVDLEEAAAGTEGGRAAHLQ